MWILFSVPNLFAWFFFRFVPHVKHDVFFQLSPCCSEGGVLSCEALTHNQKKRSCKKWASSWLNPVHAFVAMFTARLSTVAKNKPNITLPGRAMANSSNRTIMSPSSLVTINLEILRVVWLWSWTYCSLHILFASSRAIYNFPKTYYPAGSNACVLGRSKMGNITQLDKPGNKLQKKILNWTLNLLA